MSDIIVQSSLPLASHSDILEELLADKRSPNTRHAYAKDLKNFFQFLAGSDPTPELVQQFLSLERMEAIAWVMKYRQHLYGRGLKSATVNRRISAIKSLVNYARKVGQCNFTLADLKSDKVRPYRDTTGIPAAEYKKILAVPDRSCFGGKRDYAILRLLWDNALRRSEVSKLDISDVDLSGRALWVLSKGWGDEKQRVSLTLKSVEALQDWLMARKEWDINQPLFIRLDHSTWGKRLGDHAIYMMVRRLATEAGIEKLMSPHRVRHSSITTALDKTNGDVRRVQKLSRHSNLNTLLIYDDNRQDLQKEISDILSMEV